MEMVNQEVDLNPEVTTSFTAEEQAAFRHKQQHDAAIPRATIILNGGPDAALDRSQQFVDAGEQNVADSERDVEKAKADGDPERIDQAQRVLDGNRLTLATYRHWQDALVRVAQQDAPVQPDVRPAGDTHATRLRSASPRRRGGGRPAGRRVVRSSARSGDSGDSDGEPEPPRSRRPQSRLLYEEPPLVISPTLVRILGLTQAIILQQLHYWSGRSTNEHDGETWVYKTGSDWSNETGLTTKQARTALDQLRETGLVETTHNPRNKRDRTLWWRVNYDALNKLLGVSPDTDHLPQEANGEAVDHLPQEANADAPQGKCTRARGRGVSESTSEEAATSTSKVKASRDDDRAAGFLDWHSKLIEAKTGEPPERGTSAIPAAKLIVARADGDRIRSVVEWALLDRFYADKVTTAAGVERWWSRICLSHDAAVGEQQSDSGWRNVSYDGDRVQLHDDRELVAA